jgi:hypothetical protein
MKAKPPRRKPPDPQAGKIGRATRSYAVTLLRVAIELESLSDAVMRIEAALEQQAAALKRLEARP